AAGNAPTASRSAEPAASGSEGTRSLAAATRWSAGGSRRYHVGRAGGRNASAIVGGNVPESRRPSKSMLPPCRDPGRSSPRSGARPHHVDAAAAAALPFRAARFTHVWFVESLSGVSDPGAALAEAHRVVRPGGGIAIQDLFGTGRAAVEIGSWRFARPALYREAVAAAGFVD